MASGIVAGLRKALSVDVARGDRLGHRDQPYRRSTLIVGREACHVGKGMILGIFGNDGTPVLFAGRLFQELSVFVR